MDDAYYEHKRRLFADALALGCPQKQLDHFDSADYLPQPKQLLFHAAARACDRPDGPDQIGFGGARGPGKSHAAFAQLALDDCRRQPGLKALYVRKIGKQAKEQFDDLRRVVLRRKPVPHNYDRSTGTLRLWNNSQILIGNFRSEADIDKYLGLEYDVIVVEETTSLTEAKYQALRDSNRTSKDWRPRIYTTTNPGNIGHAWYRRRFIEPHRHQGETFTRFIPATVYDNLHIDAGYRRKLEENVGWKRRAYLYGDWEIAAGQYFTTFDHNLHVLQPFSLPASWWTWLAFDYGYSHPTVVLLLAEDGDGNVYVIDEHVQAGWLPARHADALRAMLDRHGVGHEVLTEVPAGLDVFSKTGELTIADQYADAGVYLVPADIDRINGAAELATLLGDAETERPPKLRIFSRCHRLIETIPLLQHDPKRPEDVLKVDVDEEGWGGDDAYDALRYGIMTRTRRALSVWSLPPPDPIEVADRGGF